MDKYLHDLLKNYADLTPKFRGKTRHRRRAELAAALRAAANSARRDYRVLRVDLRNCARIFHTVLQSIFVNSIDVVFEL